MKIKGKGYNEYAAAFFCGIFLLIILLITSTQAVCYWIPDWWRTEYAKYNTPQYVTGEMSLDDAVYITDQMLEYCIGRLDTLEDTEATIDGVTAPFFTEREKLHLADCRVIFLGAVRVRLILILVIIGLLFAVWFSIRSRHAKRSGDDAIDPDLMSYVGRRFSRTLACGYLAALIVLLVAALLIVLMGMEDFTLLFTRFHHVFFDNDLWILDPRHDNLVNVMQESVFADAAIWIGSIWAASAVLLAVISGVILGKTSDVK
ncbi:MAG: DUF1461 domain-containing protein [Mogibacterium sp.]|nr:DUF1461 domain-containing protein [Mogibacterium sp.]